MASSQAEAQEKVRSTLELTILKKNGVKNAVNLLTLRWNDLDAYFDSTQRYLEEQFVELESRENRLLSLQHSITDSNKHLDSIRQSLDERANQIQHKHLQFSSFQEEQINELKLKEKQLDVRGEKLAAHQRLIEGLFEKLDLEMKQFENIQKTVGEKLEEINLKEVQLESREARFQSAQKSIKNVLESSSHGKRRTQQSEGESSKKHKISGFLHKPEEQVESMTATEKISTPEKADFGSETLGLRRSPSDLQTRPGHSNGGEFTFSKENGSSCLANEKTNGRVDSSPNKVSEEVFHDFSQERSWEKLQNGQIWAMYKDRLPNTYVQIKNIKRYESGLVQLHIQSVEPCTMTQPLCCGRFKVQKGRAIYLQSNFFSHVVKADSISKMFLEIYPKKGQVWAIYRNWNADFSHSDLKNCYYDIVEVLDDSKQTMKVSPLVRVSGFMSVFRAPREQISNTGILVIPRGELLRFSHQIPAFQLTGEKEGKLRGYWELDFAAVPDPCLEEQGESMTASENMSTPQKADCERETNNERLGGFTLSEENTSLRSANEKTNGKVDSSPKKVSEEVFHDFTRERSCEKFQTGQIWAMYKDGLPIRYVQIKNITTYACGLHVQSLEPCTMTQPLHCGKFKVQKGKEFYSESSFSHIVKAVSISKMFFEIYPKKGQVWAIYRNWHGDLPHSDLKYYYDIVEVREDTEQSTEVSPLVRVSGFRSVFRAPEGQRSNTGVVVIPRTELGRFSHQIPAFQLTGEKEGKLKGYWELDPEALPGKI